MTTDHKLRVAIWDLGIQDRDPKVRHRVIRQISECGATPAGRDGLPMLLQALDSPDDKTRQLALFALARVAPDSDVTLDAVLRSWMDGQAINCWALGELAASAGQQAARLMPVMLPMLAEANRTYSGFHHDRLINAIGGLGEAAPAEALPLLNDAMYCSHSDERVNTAAVEALAQIGAAGLPFLLFAANDKNCPEFVRWQLIETLGELPHEADRVVPVLMQLVRDRRWSAPAARSLGRLGPAARAAGGLLVRTLTDTNADAELRATAAYALWRITGNSAPLLPTMQTLLEARPRHNALLLLVQTFAAIGPPAIEAVPCLRELLQDAELLDYARILVAVALWRIAGSLEGREQLERQVRDRIISDHEIHDWAEQAVKQLRGDA